MTTLSLSLIVLSLAGAASPLLTFAALFQLKEWRIDRLREHLRRDGVVNQLLGRIRPLIIAPWLALVLLLDLTLPAQAVPGTEIAMSSVLHIAGLIACAVLSGVQIIGRRQRIPIWTSKAILITALSIVLTTGLAVLATITTPLLYPLLMVGQFAVVLTAWLVLLPIDVLLKRRVLERAAAHRATMKGVTVIGIVGSVGKTTTKELIAHLLQDLTPHTTPARVNTEMGVAAWLTGKRGRVFVVEMGAYRTGEIALLSRITKPTIGVVTALGSDHLALFGSEEAIIAANGELLAALPKKAHAFLYGENDGCRSLAHSTAATVHLTGEHDLRAENIVEDANGLSFIADGTTFTLPLHGVHNVHNALLAIGVARHLGIDDARIAELLASVRPPAHTFQVRTERGVTVLDDTYNISPLSMEAALTWAEHQGARSRILLTSGLQETGEREGDFLRKLGQHAATRVERVIFTDVHGTADFASGYGRAVEVLHSGTERIPAGAVLLAVGRMPLSAINQVLPTAS